MVNPEDNIFHNFKMTDLNRFSNINPFINRTGTSPSSPVLCINRNPNVKKVVPVENPISRNLVKGTTYIRILGEVIPRSVPFGVSFDPFSGVLVWTVPGF